MFIGGSRSSIGDSIFSFFSGTSVGGSSGYSGYEGHQFLAGGTPLSVTVDRLTAAVIYPLVSIVTRHLGRHPLRYIYHPPSISTPAQLSLQLESRVHIILFILCGIDFKIDNLSLPGQNIANPFKFTNGKNEFMKF